MKKTYGREIAVIILLWFGYVVETKGPEIIEILAWPVFTLTAAAFGVKHFSWMQQDKSPKPTKAIDGDYVEPTSR